MHAMISIRGLALPAALLCLLLAAPAGAGSDAISGDVSSAAKAFERFKSLVGHWEGTNAQGHPVELDFELVADGSAVLERLRIAAEHPHDMVTLYHLDGDDLILTHYCAAGNQPRMVVSEASGDTIRFEFLDATNLDSPDAGHMHEALFRFLGDDRYAAEWSWREKGEEAFKAVITVERKGA